MNWMSIRHIILVKAESTIMRQFPSVLAVVLLLGWAGLDVKPLQKSRSDLAPGQSGTYAQLSDDERKELVWMAKAAKAAYSDGEKPLGYRSLTKSEWERFSAGCSEISYEEDGAFTVGSGLRGRLMVNMVNEGRVVLSLCGVDDVDMGGGLSKTVKDVLASKDIRACLEHYDGRCTPEQYRQALSLMLGVLESKPRSDLWIVGHSLGGSLTTFLAIHLPECRTRVKCATFNGYGLSPKLAVAENARENAAKRLVNVYAEGDPIYNWKLPCDVLLTILDMKAPPVHFGPSYSLVLEGDVWSQHRVERLLEKMIAKRTKWAGL